MTQRRVPPTSTALNRVRRSADLATLDGSRFDVLVIGLGVTGTGVALDAASRGLDVLAVDAHDFAFGTSRWSSKLVHGGLRYLANGQFAVAHESAVERGILMTRTAPHLIRPLATLVPFNDRTTRRQAFLARAGLLAGDLLRVAARTPRSVLGRPRGLSASDALSICPPLSSRGLRGAALGYDGQLVDDARLVTALARTAAGEGARILNHVRAVDVTGDGATLHDEVGGATFTIRASAVVNAAGVWSGQLVPGLRLKPSRGTHLVIRAESIPGLEVALTAPVPGGSNQFVFALPQPDGLVYVGLTDIEVEEITDVPAATNDEVDFLLGVINGVLARPLTRNDVVGTYSGLRPLIDSAGRTADLSRRHAVLTSETGVVTVVGGKLTTYRRMAEDAVDAVIAQRGLAAGPCRTRDLPLVGAGEVPAAVPERLAHRYGSEAGEVVAGGRRMFGDAALETVAPGSQVTLAELAWGLTHEGAVTEEDLVERRTRLALVPADRPAASAAAARALAAYAGQART